MTLEVAGVGVMDFAGRVRASVLRGDVVQTKVASLGHHAEFRATIRRRNPAVYDADRHAWEIEWQGPARGKGLAAQVAAAQAKDDAAGARAAAVDVTAVAHWMAFDDLLAECRRRGGVVLAPPRAAPDDHPVDLWAGDIVLQPDPADPTTAVRAVVPRDMRDVIGVPLVMPASEEQHVAALAEGEARQAAQELADVAEDDRKRKALGLRVVNEPDIEDRSTRLNLFTIDLLKKLLAMAESGEVQEIMVMHFDAEQDFGVVYSPTVNIVRRIGAIEVIKADYIDHLHRAMRGEAPFDEGGRDT